MTTAQLTFLRFIGATSVVIFHFGRGAKSLAWANPLWNQSNAAVAFFFVMSGFILTHVYGAKGIRRATDFYVARIARILPVYWIALALVVVFEPRQQPLSTWWVWLSALLLQSWWIGYSQILNVPGWSLSVEVFFYLLFPFLLRVLSRLRTRTVLVVGASAWAGNVALNVALYPFTDPARYPYLRDFTFYSPFTHLATFVVGMAGGIVFDRWRQPLRRFAIPLMVGSVAAAIAMILGPSWTIRYELNGLLAPLFVLFLWGLGANPDLLLARVFRWSPLVTLGEASYGLYILQLPIRYVYKPLAMGHPLSGDAVFWLYYAALVLVSVLALKWIDAPLRRAIKRVYAKVLVLDSQEQASSAN